MLYMGINFYSTYHACTTFCSEGQSWKPVEVSFNVICFLSFLSTSVWITWFKIKIKPVSKHRRGSGTYGFPQLARSHPIKAAHTCTCTCAAIKIWPYHLVLLPGDLCPFQGLGWKGLVIHQPSTQRDGTGSNCHQFAMHAQQTRHISLRSYRYEITYLPLQALLWPWTHSCPRSRHQKSQQTSHPRTHLSSEVLDGLLPRYDRRKQPGFQQVATPFRKER